MEQSRACSSVQLFARDGFVAFVQVSKNSSTWRDPGLDDAEQLLPALGGGLVSEPPDRRLGGRAGAAVRDRGRSAR